ncbi:glutamine synthetase family protein [Synechococcus sp. CS-205]|jgi:glutamine synthetase|uniref:glutamine synthetase family protein n=1 Tax=Synechococcus sp. CS-205 TaxID=2847984 RepID=UPI00223B151D|nr:glutamine synthetase family protein [Synechococcus sp. CS-205]MCT0248131.1 glutamine synthetase family protein [Synechococcus sp. CS-205]
MASAAESGNDLEACGCPAVPDVPSATALTAKLLERGLRRVAVTFVNHAGSVLAKGVPLERLPLVASQGLGFSPVSDAFGATGLIDPQQSLARPDGDLRLKPDLAALRPLDPGNGWAWAPGIRHERDGAIYALDQRGFCARQEAALAATGLSALAGFEIEWMVGQPEPAGGWIPAVAGGPYGADRLVEGLDYLSAVAEALDAAELPWLQLHPEYGAGQFELSLAAAQPLEAADRLVAARLVIQQVSRRFGWICSFAPVVTADLVGNGGHLHLSVVERGVPLLAGGAGPAGLTPRGEALLAGLLEQLPALMPLACALAVSYRRLAPCRWAAPFQVWGVENREAALRLVPAAGGEPGHLEIKVADLSANPYLLVGGVLAVLLDALQRPRVLPPPLSGDPSAAPAAEAPRLPRTLTEAVRAFETSPVLRDAMGEALQRTVVEARLSEVRRSEPLADDALIISTRAWPLTGI